MSPKKKKPHPVGATNLPSIESKNTSLATDTFGGKIHVEWDPTAAVTPIGQLPFLFNF